MLKSITANGGYYPSTDRRYAHFLSGVSKGAPVTQVVAFSCDGEVWQINHHSISFQERFLRWHVVHMIRTGNEWHTGSRTCSDNLRTFWEQLRILLQFRGTIYVVCYGAERCWPLIGLYNALQERKLRIRGLLSHVDLTAFRVPDKAITGIFVTDGPPNIAHTSIDGLPGHAVWLDLRNYGINLDLASFTGDEMAHVTASILTQLESTVRDTYKISLGNTASSTVNRIWRANERPQGIHCHANVEALAAERAAHYGGRCEAFRLGKLPYKWAIYDIQSCYAHIMATEPLPVALIGNYNFGEPDKDFAKHWPLNILARVTVATDFPRFPLRRHGIVIYPIGRFTTTLAGPELMEAFNTGCVDTIHLAFEYRLGTQISDVAKSLYTLKSTAISSGNTYVADFAKNMMVSLAGRFGQRVQWWVTNRDASAPAMWGEWRVVNSAGTLTKRRAIAGIVQDLRLGGYAPDAVPAMAVWIQSYARLRLLHAVEECGWDHVAYLDTDCVIVDDYGATKMEESGFVRDNELGAWSRRADLDTCEIRGIKYYLHGKDIKCCGRPRGLHVMAKDGEHNWYIPSASVAVKMGRTDDLYATWHDSLPPAPKYRHGEVHGEYVRPFRLEE